MAFCSSCGQTMQDGARFCSSCGQDQSAAIGTMAATAPVVTGPKCPTCSSTDIEKISLKNKIGSAALVGVFALGRISKTFKCNGCGYRW
jgi:RNA polymerase subunit RPABC4/transcription elongation factor Spt4